MPSYPWQNVKDPLAIPSGSLRHPIQVQQQTPAVDTAGQPLPTWTTVLSVMAAIATLSESEKWQTAQFSSQVTHRITLRWPGASIPIAGGMRVLYVDAGITRVFLVQAAENVQERNRVVHMMCLEINGAV